MVSDKLKYILSRMLGVQRMVKNKLPDQYAKIWGSNWKYLIVLDACRYDYFEKVYKDYSIIRTGKLEKVYSPDSTTIEWFERIFEGRKVDDIVCVSANPYINSKGIPHEGFNPKLIVSRFYKVIDIWDWGWDEN